MNNNALILNQSHIDNLAKKALELSKTNGQNFVMAHEVDNANNSDSKNAVETFTLGKTTYTKVQ